MHDKHMRELYRRATTDRPPVQNAAEEALAKLHDTTTAVSEALAGLSEPERMIVLSRAAERLNRKFDANRYPKRNGTKVARGKVRK